MRSEEIGELAKALAAAQGEIKGAAKDSVNPHFKSAYADLASIWDACRAALTKHGIAVIQAPNFDATEICLSTILAHTSGQWISGRLPVRPVQNTPQGMGSALTYARRYGLAAMVGVAPDDDDGEEASRPAAKAAPRKAGNGFRIQHEAKPEPDEPTMADNKFAEAMEKLDIPNIDLALFVAEYKKHTVTFTPEQKTALNAKFLRVEKAREKPAQEPTVEKA